MLVVIIPTLFVKVSNLSFFFFFFPVLLGFGIYYIGSVGSYRVTWFNEPFFVCMCFEVDLITIY